MGIGPMNLGGQGQKQGVHACGTPMNAASGSPITKLTSEAQKQALILLLKKKLKSNANK
jgi:hypothetical protein